MMHMTVQAYAKINLFLDITGRRVDGYHTIAGVMQAVSLADRVSVTVDEPIRDTVAEAGAVTPQITLYCSDPTLPTDGKNLAVRAAEAFFAAADCGCERLAIDLEKHIPAAAGLAGGSADAAAVLTALNTLFDRPLDDGELARVGLSLGADVPFCLVGGACLTEGVGETLTRLPSLPDCDIVIAIGGAGVSTPSAYRALDQRYGGFAAGAYCPRKEELDALVLALQEGSSEGVAARAFNLFELVVLPIHPEATRIRACLEAHGAATAMMSGSGPSVFGLFPKGSADAEKAVGALRDEGFRAEVCHPVESIEFCKR